MITLSLSAASRSASIMYSNCEANAIQNPILKIVGEKILLVLSGFALTENYKKTKSSKKILKLHGSVFWVKNFLTLRRS